MDAAIRKKKSAGDGKPFRGKDNPLSMFGIEIIKPFFVKVLLLLGDPYFLFPRFTRLKKKFFTECKIGFSLQIL